MPKGWRAGVQYVRASLWSRRAYGGGRARPPAALAAAFAHLLAPAAPAPCRGVAIRELPVGSAHPAAGQCGLFATRRYDRGETIIDYVGELTADGDEDPTSDYTMRFVPSRRRGVAAGLAGERLGVVVDAARAGNEARFVNDYRGTGRPRNAAIGEYLQGGDPARPRVAFVAAAPIARGDEILVSYGKGFWQQREAEAEEAEARDGPASAMDGVL